MPKEKARNFYRIRQRLPGQFGKFRYPEWASHAAASVVPGAKVVTGRYRKDSPHAGEWAIQSILIPRGKVRDYAAAERKAKRIRGLLERKKSSAKRSRKRSTRRRRR